MFILYDLIYIIYAIFYLPVLYFKGKRITGIANRFAFYHQDFIKQLNNGKTIWLQAVSVGEILSSVPLLKLLKEKFSTYRLVISTTTSAGYLMAQKIKSPQDLLIYFPFDLNMVIKRVVSTLNPVLFITIEKEFWPNLVNRLHKNKIPIVVINGRMSNKSLARYKKVKFLIKSFLNKVSLFCMQTQKDALGIAELGVSQDKIKITGNIKFDAVGGNEAPQDKKEKYYNQLALDNRRLLVAGSTHKGEEEILINSYHELGLKGKGWILLIAPRHLERIKEVEEIARRYDYQPAKISDMLKVDKKDAYIYILDIMGELKAFYSLADLVFVGGSLIPFGGHNLIEPAYFSKAIIFGEYVFNFQDIAEELIAQEAAIKVKNVQELKGQINNLVNNKEKIANLGQKARRVVMSNLGATQRNIQEIEKILE